tara:strand:+ start:697 stop:903 length:207 start_codon:yes stop_codon:yes gene_type:complete
MNIRTLIIALLFSVGLFAACTDKKKTKDNVETEVISKEKKTTVKDTADKAEKRTLDSIRQVKEHGHAH